MLRAALYARVSTELQKDEETVQNQLTEIRRVIAEDGNSLLDSCEYIDEGWSGAILERPSLDIMRQDAREKKFDILYVYDKGRLARKYVYQEIVIEELANLDITFKSLHDINGTTPEEQVMGGVMGIFHEYERVKITERFRIGKLNKVRSGKLLGYQAPYGYDYVPIRGKGVDKINGKFVINEEEAEVVKMIFEWIGIECVSIKEVVRRLYDLGVMPKKQKRDTWSTGPIHRMLKNETYIGKHFYYKSESCITSNPMARTQKKYQHRHTMKGSRKIRPREEWLEVKAPRIISDELFNQATAQVKSNGKHSQRCKRNPYLFGSLIQCPCGATRTGEGQNGHFYYRCTDRLLKFPKPRTCFEAGVNVQVLDSLGWNKLVELMTSPKLLKEQLDRYSRENIPKIGQDSQKNELNGVLKLLEEEERRYVKAWGMGTMSEKIYSDQMNSVFRRRKELSDQLTRLDNDKVTELQKVDLNTFVKPFKQFLTNLSYEDKLFTVRKIVDKVIATKEQVTICGMIPIYAVGQEKVGLDAKYRNRRLAERWQINFV
ncbi:MAG TPA: recombinase family protein [Candidatus Saccharimonadales bacterium]|nr:recombinase family protein [Candidatus Saccharimonadales bacterium]